MAAADSSASPSLSPSPSSSPSVAIGRYSEGPPWIFRGRALYQLHAVKSSVARRFIPPELKLVEAFGYTLGGLFLAHYDDSPAGEFDEAVVIAGIVWNAPTSCAWAAGVLVGNEEARVHGRREVGLPSHLASFSHNQVTSPRSDNSSSPVNLTSAAAVRRPWWDARAWLIRAPPLRLPSFRKQPQRTYKVEQSVEITKRDGSTSTPLCHILGIPGLTSNQLSSPSLPSSGDIHQQQVQEQRFKGPSIRLHLPNFSGKTKEQPHLLKYSCALSCRVRVVAPARVIGLTSSSTSNIGSSSPSSLSSTSDRLDLNEKELDEKAASVDRRMTTDWVSILTGKPLASIFFDQMVMHVEAPLRVVPKPDTGTKQRRRLTVPETERAHDAADLVLPQASPAAAASKAASSASS